MPGKPAARVLTLAPKCVLAYGGIGAVLGLRGPEICGATVGSRGSWGLALAGLGAAPGIVGWLWSLRGRRNACSNVVRREAVQVARGDPPAGA
jgi:hypothetical protein